MKRFRYVWLFALCVPLVLSGCDPVTRYKVASTIFDGVPDLPPPEELCKEYAEQKIAEAATAVQKESKKGPVGSQHMPYEEKKCDDCHDKNKESGLVRPKKDLCLGCHTDFVKGSYVHGPVATADCLVCHEPHTSAFPSLLKLSPEKICDKCHREKRVSAGMHDKFAARQLFCVNCHDPHSSNAQYFMK